MAIRTINSPGVEIRERDLSVYAPNNVGTTVFVTGFANQGPTDEVIKISSRDELELVYGTPTNSPERYLYHTVRELLNSPANIYVSRMPYGEGNGDGFSTKYSALAYPVSSVPAASTYELSISNPTSLSNNTLSTTKVVIPVGNTTKTIAFSSTTFNPSDPSVDYIVRLTGTTVDNFLTGIQTAIGALDTTVVVASTFNGGYSKLTTTFADKSTNYSLSTNLASLATSYTKSNNSLSADGTYFLGAPVHLELTEDQYNSILDGSGFEWSKTPTSRANIKDVNSLGGAGVIVLNKAQTTINDQFEGYYVGIADNFNVNPATNFNSILSVKTLNTSVTATSSYISIPDETLQFKLSTTYNSGIVNTVSEIMEKLTDYDISGREDDDLLNVAVFKLRKSVFATEAFKLDYVLEDAVVGSINYHRQITDKNGGLPTNFYLESVAGNSRNVKVLVNDFISNRLSNSSNVNGQPKKKIRVLTNEIINNYDIIAAGALKTELESLAGIIGYADNLYGLGAYNGVETKQKVLGDIPSKLDRILDGVRNDDIYELDVVVEAGLGTIYAAASGAGKDYYDETLFNTTLANQVNSLRSSGALTTTGETIRANYTTIFNKFANFCSPPYNGGGRGDCFFIADPLRHIFVTGSDNKVVNKKDFIFQRDIYWAIRHQFEFANTSYAGVYGTWAKVYDSYIGQQVWVPFSGFAATAMVRTDAERFPWIAPAGFNNGLITTANDICVTPNQKQRDELYKANINPVTFIPSQGVVIMGQKTLSRKPSAFDRVNVRRLFLALERPTKKASQFFVFEPNTTFTRTRLLNTLIPIFDRAKNNEGLYDYLLVCDERNNTAQVIDNNELVVDIYLKPVKASEFILVNFTATRTDTNFQEIIGG